MREGLLVPLEDREEIADKGHAFGRSALAIERRLLRIAYGAEAGVNGGFVGRFAFSLGRLRSDGRCGRVWTRQCSDAVCLRRRDIGRSHGLAFRDGRRGDTVDGRG